jgi:predicted branched-subunit amino acid permease
MLRPVATSPGKAAADGVRDGLAVTAGYVPFALALGAAITASGVDPLAGWSSSWLLFAGAAQLTAIQLLDSGAAAVVVVATVLVVNARHVMYSAAMAPHMGAWPQRWRWSAAYLLADPVYVVAATRFERDDGPASQLGYYLGAGVTMWLMWQTMTGAGVLLSARIPTSLPLHLAAPLTFLVLLVPVLRDRASITAALTGALVTLAGQGLPLRLGLLAGALAGVLAGTVTAARSEVRDA